MDQQNHAPCFVCVKRGSPGEKLPPEQKIVWGSNKGWVFWCRTVAA